MIRRCDHAGGIVELTLDAPPVNAINLADLAAMTAMIRSIPTDPTTTVVLITSVGAGFCAGGDVKEILRLPDFEGILGQVEGSLELTIAMAECPLPIVASIRGYCVGLGVLIAASADVIICAADTTFTLAEVDNGATTGVIQALGIMPDKVMRAAMLTGNPVEADVLARTGHVHEIVPAAELSRTSMAMATTISAKDPLVLRALKRTIRGSATPDIRALYRQEMSHTYALNMRGSAAAVREKNFTKVSDLSIRHRQESEEN